MGKEGLSGQERRKYIRLDSVFPVQFRLASLDGKSFLSGWLQGFTNDVGKGGICLSVNNLPPELAGPLKERRAKLFLNIEIPLAKNPVSAQAEVSWLQGDPVICGRYLIGLNYKEIDPRQNRRIIRYALARRLLPAASLGVIILLGAFLIANSVINAKLAQGNKALVEQLVKIVQESGLAKQKVKELAGEREALQAEIQALGARMQAAEGERRQIEGRAKYEVAAGAKKIEGLNSLIGQLAKEKDSLQEQLIAVRHKEDAAAEDILRLDKRKATLEKANLEKMYQWLKVHQNPRTGLVMSFEGASDIANWAFTYDQALAAQAYAYFSDFERARKIFDFFSKKAKRKGGLFFNGYYVNDGSPAEYVLHSGPNIWLGIAALQYTARADDNRYLKLAEEIARGIINLQEQDSEGGIRGGPDVKWFATEHNLDACAFFNMLYKITAKPQYRQAADKALEWIVRHTYGQPDLPIKRGKGDSTIATDTYAWSIAAIGPEKLEALGMNPDGIMDFAEKNCGVEVSYTRPQGQTIRIKGFDFAPQRNLARGGIVSSEWTAQMIIAFKIMADFYYKKGMAEKGRSYADKADEYLSGLANMVISSPSPSGQGEGCLPYATQDFADTGHGWFTPKGAYTGSVAGTTYAIFAYYNYNPLELKD